MSPARSRVKRAKYPSDYPWKVRDRSRPAWLAQYATWRQALAAIARIVERETGR